MATHAILAERSGRITHGPIQEGTSAREASIYIDPDQLRRPEYTVYLHSISKRSFEQPHPIYRNIIIPACPKDRRYYTFMRITHPVQISTIDPNNVSGPLKWEFESAIRAALCVCNPSYVGNNLDIQDKPISDQYQISSQECNLTRQGIFASLNEIPTDEELAKAEKRLIDYHSAIHQRMNELWRADPKKAQEELTIDHHLAAERFGQEVAWHLINTPKIDCPNCGDKIKEGIAYHYSNGQRCVLDWERTYLAGAVKKDDVPDAHRWWKEEKSKDQLRQDATALGIEVDARWSAETLQTKINEALST
jgi:hypothetical protein